MHNSIIQALQVVRGNQTTRVKVKNKQNEYPLTEMEFESKSARDSKKNEKDKCLIF